MQLSDDAPGRVTIFSVEETIVAAAVPGPPPTPSNLAAGVTLSERVGQALDSPVTPMVLALALVAILVLGLLLTRH